jgi:hypothetical protein
MHIVIDIDDKVYGLLKYFEKGLGLNDKKEDDDVKTALIRAVVNGTPLPKGHGRLKDADALAVSIENKYADMELDGYDPLSLGTYANMVDDLVETAPTIIEADKEV